MLERTRACPTKEPGLDFFNLNCRRERRERLSLVEMLKYAYRRFSAIRAVIYPPNRITAQQSIADSSRDKRERHGPEILNRPGLDDIA